MENLYLTQILKDCPKGTKLYSPLFGEVTFDVIVDTIVKVIEDVKILALTTND